MKPLTEHTSGSSKMQAKFSYSRALDAIPWIQSWSRVRRKQEGGLGILVGRGGEGNDQEGDEAGSRVIGSGNRETMRWRGVEERDEVEIQSGKGGR